MQTDDSATPIGGPVSPGTPSLVGGYIALTIVFAVVVIATLWQLPSLRRLLKQTCCCCCVCLCPRWCSDDRRRIPYDKVTREEPDDTSLPLSGGSALERAAAAHDIVELPTITATYDQNGHKVDIAYPLHGPAPGSMTTYAPTVQSVSAAAVAVAVANNAPPSRLSVDLHPESLLRTPPV
jgi:hypothetical protein